MINSGVRTRQEGEEERGGGKRGGKGRQGGGIERSVRGKRNLRIFISTQQRRRGKGVILGKERKRGG